MNEIFGYVGNQHYDEYMLSARADSVKIGDFFVVYSTFLTPFGECSDFVHKTLKLQRHNKDEIIRQFNADNIGDLTLAYTEQDNNTIYCRMGATPLVIGIGNKGFYLADTVLALNDHCNKYIALCYGEMAKITKDKVVVFNPKNHKIKKIPQSVADSGYAEYDFAPNDEIYCCSVAIKNALANITTDNKIALDHLKINRYNADKINGIVLIGQGSDYNACLCAKEIFELLTDIPTTVKSGIEFIHCTKIIDKNTLVIPVSQKGDNTPTAISAQYAVKNNAKVVAVTSNSASHLARICPYIVNPKCEMTTGAVSLKSFFSSYISLCFVALYLGQKRGIVSDLYLNVAIKMAQMLCGKLMESTKPTPALDKLQYMANNAQNLVVTGCGIDYAISLEASQKLSLLANINPHNVAMDTLYLAPISTDTTILAIISNKDYLSYTSQVLQKAKDNGAQVVIVTTANIETELTHFDHIISFSDSIPIFNTLPILAGLYKISIQKDTQIENVS